MAEDAAGENPSRKTRRVQFELPAKSVERLEKLKAETGATSYAEVVRAALRVYEWYSELEAQGMEMCVVKDGQVTKVMVLL